MNNSRIRPLLTMVPIVLALVACRPPPGSTTSHGGAVRDHPSFVDHLRGAGLTVDIGDPVKQPFLTAPGILLKLSGGRLEKPAEVQSFEFDDNRGAEADAEKIDPDGQPRTMMIQWIAPPHFFRTGRIVVLYVGSDEAVLELLTSILGPPFAGR